MVAAALAFVVLSAGPAEAKKGVSVSLGRIELERPLAKGRAYTLPPISVSNPGDEPSTYRLGVNYIGDQPQHRPPVRWFSFSDGLISLRPSESKAVTVRLHVPANAQPGSYQALLEAALVSAPGPGASVGAAAARLTFEVKASGWLEAQWSRVKQLLADASPWPEIFAVAGALSASWWWLSRRFTLSIGRRPQEAGAARRLSARGGRRPAA
jgi:hypothetical protein